MYQIDKYDTIYFCEHTFSQFDAFSSQNTVRCPGTTVVRTHYKDICFVCTNCHMDVVRTFKNYWLELSDMANYFQQCFLRKKNKLKIKNSCKNLKGTISIGCCRGHETFIIILNFKGHKETHTRFLSLDYGF